MDTRQVFIEGDNRDARISVESLIVARGNDFTLGCRLVEVLAVYKNATKYAMPAFQVISHGVN